MEQNAISHKQPTSLSDELPHLLGISFLTFSTLKLFPLNNQMTLPIIFLGIGPLSNLI